jgi:glucose-6-phosphate isomerase
MGGLAGRFDKVLARLEEDEVIARIWRRDHTVWSDSPDEIANRLGWLDLPEAMMTEIGCIYTLRDEVRELGWDRAVLLGMGGSSLAPELFAATFPGDGRVRLSVLDSTDPAAVIATDRSLDLGTTLFIVATKSGTTVETISLFKYFYGRAREEMGDSAASHFVAITDPGSALETTAEELGFRATFLNDPDLGGRFSALSFFGLVPAGLIGADLDALLERARGASNECGPGVAVAENPAARLGAFLGAAAASGRGAALVTTGGSVARLGDWVEQLVAESTGKDGKGVLPVVGPGAAASLPEGAGVAVDVRVEGESASDAPDAMPRAVIELGDPYDLGGQFFIWEMATAVLGNILGIHPFNQPDVESAKVRAREMVAAFRRDGALPEEDPVFIQNGIAAYGDVSGSSLDEGLDSVARRASEAAYVAVQAYLPPTPGQDELLAEMRGALAGTSRRPVTIGYGPRFLHSTGQLHKGDAGEGLFIQITAGHPEDVAIPDEPGSIAGSLSFGTLIDAQASGDMQALREAGRSVVRFHLGEDATRGLQELIALE